MNKQTGKLPIIILATCFFLGILYQNLIAKPQILPAELLSQSNIQHFINTDIITEKFMWYVAKERLMLLAIICVLSYMKWKKTLVGTCLGITGFLSGIFTVSSILQFGAKGILFAIASVIPHGLFYGMSYAMIFTYWFTYPTGKWNRMKLIFVITMFLMGIILETYVNPPLMKWIMKFLLK